MSTSRFVESAFWNFDSMFVPQQHPAREVQDTFYVKSRSLPFRFLYPSTSSPLHPFYSPSIFARRPCNPCRHIPEESTNPRPTQSRSTRRRILSKSSKSPRIRRIRFNRLSSPFLSRRFREITIENTYNCCFYEYVVQDC